MCPGTSTGRGKGGEDRAQPWLYGPAASTTVPGSEGAIDALRYISDEGLLDGIKLELHWEDVRAEPPRAVVCYKRLKETGVVAVYDIVLGCSETLAPMAQRDQIPIIHETGMTPLLWTEPIRWVFVATPGYSSEFTTLMKWAKNNWYNDLGRAPRFGILTHEHASGYELLDAIPWIRELGWEHVGTEIVPPLGAIDTSVEWLRLVAEKPDVIFMYTWGATICTVVKDSQRPEKSKPFMCLGQKRA